MAKANENQQDAELDALRSKATPDSAEAGAHVPTAAPMTSARGAVGSEPGAPEHGGPASPPATDARAGEA